MKCMLELPEFDMERLLDAWQDAVFGLYLAEEKIEPEVVENMRSWEHSGFSVDQSVLLPAGDQAGIERLVQYMTRCPFSLSLGEGERHRADRLPSREAGLPGLSRPAGRWDASGSAAEFPDPATARFPGAASPANWARSTFHRRARI